jgi:hypothetical protein
MKNCGRENAVLNYDTRFTGIVVQEQRENGQSHFMLLCPGGNGEEQSCGTRCPNDDTIKDFRDRILKTRGY